MCRPRPPPAALPGMFHSLTGDTGGGGADNIPCSFLRDPTCTLLPTAVEVSATNQEAATNFPLRQQQMAGLSFSLTAWKQTSHDSDGGHLAFCTKVSLGERDRPGMFGGAQFSRKRPRPTSRATAEEAGFTFIFRLIQPKGQASWRPSLCRPSPLEFSAYLVDSKR